MTLCIDCSFQNRIDLFTRPVLKFVPAEIRKF
jgi:hypothetical protein